MKILLITDLYPIENGTEPKTIRNFAINWQKSGHFVDVLRTNFMLNTLVRKRKIYPEKIFYDEGVKIYNLNFFTPFWFDIKQKLPKDFKVFNYDLVVSHMPCGALVANKLLKRLLGIPYVCSVHASDLKVIEDKFYKIFFAKPLLAAYKRADAISARNAEFAEKIKKLSEYAEYKTFIAPSGIPYETIESEEYFLNKALKKSDTFVITTVAKLIRRKNVDLIIKALYKAHIDNFIFRIIGDGPEKSYLKKIARIRKIESKLIFEGEIPHEEVNEKLKLSDLFVLVSEGETFGISYLEAAAKANIVIATEKGGIDGIIINGKNGFTCPPDDDKLAELIKKIYGFSPNEKRKILSSLRNTIINCDDNEVSKRYLEKAFCIINS